MALASMTGYADLGGHAEAVAWSWEARSVNSRGLDLRMRLPDGFEALETRVRETFGMAFARGSITVALRLTRGASTPVPRLNPVGMEAALDAAAEAAVLARARGIDVAPPGLGEILALRGVLDAEAALPSEDAGLLAAIGGQIAGLAVALSERREAEGAGLRSILARRLDELARLTAAARQTAEARAARTGALLRSRVAALLEAAPADPARLEQELALLAVRADVTEELDRLDAHVAAARDLLDGAGPHGRKLDFLTQEFNREANTLCSKAGDAALGAVGLQMKVAIDQMREQVQNVE